MKIALGDLFFDVKNDSFIDGVRYDEIIRYCKMVYTNRKRFIKRFIEPLKKGLMMYGEESKINIIDTFLYYFDNLEPYTYEEAFKIQNTTFKSLVFSSINISELISELGHEMIKVEGKNVTHRRYKEDGSYEMINYDVIYELHRVNCSKILPNADMLTQNSQYAYAIKCWCTTTNNEHWLWVEEEYANKGPLEAIASTVRVYENMIPFIKEIKRQGDVFLFEMSEKIIPSGKIIPLTSNQYFDLLVAQT